MPAEPIKIDTAPFIERAIKSSTPCDALKSRRRFTNVLYGIFVELAKQIYSEDLSNSGGAEQPYPIWRDDSTLSGIWIDTEYRWEDLTPTARPAIYVALGALNIVNIDGTPHGIVHEDIAEAVTVYGRDITGTASFIHIGRTKGETVRLVDNTGEYIDGLANVIRREFCFTEFGVTSIIPLQPVKAEKDHLRGGVAVKFRYLEEFGVKLESPKLKRIVMMTGQSIVALI